MKRKIERRVKHPEPVKHARAIMSYALEREYIPIRHVKKGKEEPLGEDPVRLNWEENTTGERFHRRSVLGKWVNLGKLEVTHQAIYINGKLTGYRKLKTPYEKRIMKSETERNHNIKGIKLPYRKTDREWHGKKTGYYAEGT